MNAKQEYIDNALDNIKKGYWLEWKDAMKVKIGDVLHMKKHDFDKNGQDADKDVIYVVNSLTIRETEFGFKELHMAGDIATDFDEDECGTYTIIGGVSGVLSVRLNANVDTLYSDDNVILDMYNGKYRLSFFKDCHWVSEVLMDNMGNVQYESNKDCE